MSKQGTPLVAQKLGTVTPRSRAAWRCTRARRLRAMTKGWLRFDPVQQLPASLVCKLIHSRRCAETDPPGTRPL